MNFDELGLVFEQEIKKGSNRIRLRDSVVPRALFFGTVPSVFGLMTLVWCDEGLCYLGFDERISIGRIQKFFPHVSIAFDPVGVKSVFRKVMDSWENGTEISLVVKGTDFQRRVWEALPQIPIGHVASYGSVAEFIGKPSAVRAVGAAVGADPVSLIIPCHRVIQKNGSLSNYGWGNAIKEKILRIESELNRDSESPAYRKNRRAG